MVVTLSFVAPQMLALISPKEQYHSSSWLVVREHDAERNDSTGQACIMWCWFRPLFHYPDTGSHIQYLIDSRSRNEPSKHHGQVGSQSITKYSPI